MYRKLRGKIVEHYGTINAFADAIGTSRVSVSLKLNGKTGFDAATIKTWAEALSIPISEAGIYFFDSELSQN